MKKVLITGGAGFIGLNLSKNFLAKGYQVDILDNFSRGVEDTEIRQLSTTKNVKLLQKDLLKVGSLDDLGSDYSLIFHLAAIIGVAHVLKRPFAVLKDNTLMTVEMLELARKQKNLQRFIFASTSEVYAGTLQHFELPVPTPETTPLALTNLDHPRTSYMLSKIYGEALCHQSGIPFTLIRPHNVYGPRMGLSHVIPELYKKAHEAAVGQTIEVASSHHRRAFCYIDDAIEMISRGAESPQGQNETLNIGNERAEVSIGELAQLILNKAGKDLKIKTGPETSGSPSRRCPDMKHTEKITGYRPQVDLEEGVTRTLNWYRENIFSGKEVSAK